MHFWCLCRLKYLDVAPPSGHKYPVTVWRRAEPKSADDSIYGNTLAIGIFSCLQTQTFSHYTGKWLADYWQTNLIALPSGFKSLLLQWTRKKEKVFFFFKWLISDFWEENSHFKSNLFIQINSNYNLFNIYPYKVQTANVSWNKNRCTVNKKLLIDILKVNYTVLQWVIVFETLMLQNI